MSCALGLKHDLRLPTAITSGSAKPEQATLVISLVHCHFFDCSDHCCLQADSSGSDLEGLTASLQRKAAAKLVQLRRPEYDPPCRVAEGLYIGEFMAAFNWPHQIRRRLESCCSVAV